MSDKTAAARYKSLSENERKDYLQRARESAKVTVPTLMPDEGHTRSSKFPTPYQSLGARGVRTVSSKLLLALYPANTPCFRYQIDDFALQEIAEGQGTRGDIEKALDTRARAVKTEMENTKFRPIAFEGVRQLVVSGNYLLFVPSNPKEYPRGWRLDSYVVRRDPSGNIVEIIIEEEIAFALLPEDVQDAIKSKPNSEKDIDGDTPFTMYTVVERRADGKFDTYQEVEGERVPDSDGVYTEETLPYIPLRFTALDGESYGRSFVEEFLGDLLTLEGLAQSILEAAALHSKVLFLVNPNGSVIVEDLQDAENGDFVEGLPDEVSALQVGKGADLSVASSLNAEISQRLAQAFMLHSSVQRNAERVTAEEIRRLTEELDDALGGVYSLLSVEFQLPAVRLYEKRMEKAKNVPKLPDEVDVKPVIITGVEALGRAKELGALDNFVANVTQFVPGDQVGRVINLREYFKQRASALSLDSENLIVSEQQQGQDAQMAQMMDMLKQALPQLIQQGGGLAKEGMKQQQQQTEQEEA